VSYRTFKHLLGETSLERKCRFIFGGGILTLVTLSFYLYGRKTESLVIGQMTESARNLVEPVLQIHHNKKTSSNYFSFADPSADPSYQSRVLSFHRPPGPDEPPPDDFERDAMTRFRRAALRSAELQRPGVDPGVMTFLDGTPMAVGRALPGRREYQYIQALLFKPSCLTSCHPGVDNHQMRQVDGGKFDYVRPGDLAGAVEVRLPMEGTNTAIHQNRAILITAALVTAILAMVASYVIVRYVIVKPVKHLRDVSDAIAAGKLNVRSQIQTGDEFEELSHAFNRMLHNLVAMQQELREVNGDLDRKVDELAQANLALFEMNRLKSDFLATMSHELRTPLNSIIGFSEVLSGTDALGERQRRYAANIQTSGKMLLGMINDILDLAKIESGKMEVRVEDFSIRDVCEALTAAMRPTADRKNVDLECRLDEAIPLLRQDPVKIRQILYNLVSNAIKFTPEGGRVGLRASVEGRSLVLAVEDTGIGIALEDRDKIFEKFRQGPSAGPGGSVLTREHQGTGLGLSIVRELAKLLGGDVHLDSQPGRGSTFTVRLPLQLATSRRFEVALSDERIDLSKARRVEPRPSGSAIAPSPFAALPPPPIAADPAASRRPLAEPLRGRDGLRVDHGRPRP